MQTMKTNVIGRSVEKMRVVIAEKRMQMKGGGVG